MKPLSLDLSIYNQLKLDNPPVAVKFLISRPEGINQIDTNGPFCEMIKEAWNRPEPFYFTKENEDCVGKVALGMEELDVAVEAGLVGPRFGIYQEPRANNSLFSYVSTFHKGLVNFVAFSTIDKLTFDPDLLILMTKPAQAEIIVRASGYLTGAPIESKMTTALGCSWMYIYPFQSGKINYMVTGLTFGAKAKQIFEEGRILFTIPYHQLPAITKSLNEMEWELPSYSDGRQAFMEREAGIFTEAHKEATT